MKHYFVYILTNFTNKVLYTGVTNNVFRRNYQHIFKVNDGFTAKYNVHKLVYFEVYNNPTEAILREKTIKNLVRRKKIILIEKVNPNWKDLSKDLLY